MVVSTLRTAAAAIAGPQRIALPRVASLDDARPYQMSMTEKMDLLRESGVLSNLGEEGLTEDQVREFLYDNWHTEHPIDDGSKGTMRLRGPALF